MKREIPYDRFRQLVAFTSIEGEAFEAEEEVATADAWRQALGQGPQLFSGSL